MFNLKKYLLMFFLCLILVEIISYSFFKLNLLDISHTPKLYLKKDYIPNDEWWNEEEEWGAWHKVSSSTIQKKKLL